MLQEEYGVLTGQNPGRNNSADSCSNKTTTYRRRIVFRQDKNQMIHMDQLNEVVEEEDKDAIPHLMMTNSSLEDDDEDDGDRYFPPISHDGTMASTFSYVANASSELDPNCSTSSCDVSSLDLHPSSLHRNCSQNGRVMTSSTVPMRRNHAHKVPYFDNSWSDRDIPERNFQRTWHGGYNYLPAPIPPTTTSNKQHKRWFSSDDVAAQSSSSTSSRRRRHVNQDSFNNLEELSFYHYTHNQHEKHPYASSSFDECAEYLTDKHYDSEIHPLMRTKQQHSEVRSVKTQRIYNTNASPFTNRMDVSSLHLLPIEEPKEEKFLTAQSSMYDEHKQFSPASNPTKIQSYFHHGIDKSIDDITAASSSCSSAMLPKRSKGKYLTDTIVVEQPKKNKRWTQAVWRRLRYHHEK